MKTLSKKSAMSRLEKLTIKSDVNLRPVSKSSIAYKFAIEVIEGVKVIRPTYTSGSGRFTSNQDHSKSTMELLDKIGVEYIFTNDAPRGGLTGNKLTITTKFK